MKCKYEGSGVWEGRCVGTKEVDPCVGYEKCDRFRPNCQTNADHIRSMTDEELAEFLSKPWCENHRFKSECLRFDTDCVACVLDWLQKPYKEDE